MSLPVISPRYLHTNEVLFRYRNEVADHNGIQFKKTGVFFNIKLKLLLSSTERNDKGFTVNLALFFRLKLFFKIYIQQYYTKN